MLRTVTGISRPERVKQLTRQLNEIADVSPPKDVTERLALFEGLNKLSTALARTRDYTTFRHKAAAPQSTPGRGGPSDDEKQTV